MSFLTEFTELQRRLEEPAEALVDRLDYPSAWETGVTHPFLPAHLLCRDDGVVELASGTNASVHVDGDQQQITLEAGKLALSAQDLHLHGGPLGLWFGYQRFDPLSWWTEDPLFQDPTRSLWNGPLVLNDITGLSTLESLPFVVGAPQAGQSTTVLSSLFHPQPLLGPNEFLRILAERMGSLAQELAP